MSKNDIVVLFHLGLIAAAIIWAVVYTYLAERERKKRQEAFDGYFKCWAARNRRHYVNKTEQPKTQKTERLC